MRYENISSFTKSYFSIKGNQIDVNANICIKNDSLVDFLKYCKIKCIIFIKDLILTFLFDQSLHIVLNRRYLNDTAHFPKCYSILLEVLKFLKNV